MRTYLSHLKRYFDNYVEGQGQNYDRHLAMEYIFEKCWREYLLPNRDAIIKDWLLIYTSHWGRQKRTLEYQDRQLEFAGNWFGARRIKLPSALQLKDRKILLPRTKHADWMEYLEFTLERNLKDAATQRASMERLYRMLLKDIYAEHPGIEFARVIEIAYERGLLRERKEGRRTMEGEA